MQWLFITISLLLAAGAGYWVYRTDKRRAVPYPWITATLRALLVLLVLLLLVAPYITITKNETKKPVILFLQDKSTSVAEALKGDTAAYRNNVNQLLNKLAGEYNVVRWGFGGETTTDSIFTYNQQTTDIAAALEKAQEFYGLQNLGAVVLASDGRYNTGINPQYAQLPMEAPLYTVALGDSAAQKDIRIAKVYANKVVSLNSQFEIRADVIANQLAGYNGNVQLKTADGSIAGSSALTISSNKYDRAVSFTIKATKAGLNHYILTVHEAEGESNTANNRRDVFVEVVDEQKKVLIAGAAPHPDINAIKQALEGIDRYKLTVKTGSEVPSSFAGYQVVILHQLPSQNMLLPQMRNANIPAWYILGTQSNTNAAGQMQSVAKLGMNPIAMRDIMASLNTSFNLFTLPQNIQSVLDRMPPLSVPAGTVQISPDASVLLQQRNDNPALPLWAMQQGQKSTVLTLGEGLWRWRLYEYRHFGTHETVDEMIRQSVAFLAANTLDKPFRTEMPKYVWSDQENININAYLLNASNEQVNAPEATITISDSAGNKKEYTFGKSGKAYSLNAGIMAGGTYTYTAATNYNGRSYTSSGSFVVESTPLELMETGADYPMLYGLANKYGGQMVSSNNVGALYDMITNSERIQPVIEEQTETAPIIDNRWLFFLILLVAVTEWLLRKYWMAQ